MTLEDPKDFVDEVYKIFVVMEPTDTKKSELASYQLKGGYGGHIYWESTVGFLATQGFCTDMVQDVAI